MTKPRSKAKSKPKMFPVLERFDGYFYGMKFIHSKKKVGKKK